MTSVFAEWETKVWKYRYNASAVVHSIHGSTPDDPKVIKGWISSKVQDNDERIQEAVAETMVELGISAEEATERVIEKASVNRFKRDENGLYIEGRTIKAAIKEAAMTSAQGENGIPAEKKYGVLASKKGLKAFIAEHIQVEDRRVHLGVFEADRVMQKFVQTRGISGISYEEEIDEAKISFTVSTDFDFSAVDPNWWAKVWVHGQKQGLAGSRSQGFGAYEITRWDPVTE